MKEEQTTLSTQKAVLEIQNVRKYFTQKKGLFSSSSTNVVRAVDGISFDIKPNEVFGLVGESGCGKTTLGRMIVRLLHPTSGCILYQGKDIHTSNHGNDGSLCCEIQMIFQDPSGSLNSRKSVKEILGRPLLIHRRIGKRQVRENVKQLLDEVGLPLSVADHRPSGLSGGQQQRVAIARALSLEPQVLVADEPTSALDVSIQTQILQLIQQLKDKRQLSMLFISHDLAVVKYLSDRTGVMYLGELVEIAPVNDLYHHPKHPYTQALISAVPRLKGSRERKRIILREDLDTVDISRGCRFYPRCWLAEKVCRQKEPTLRLIGYNHFVACHLVRNNSTF